jgi:hypothetical protein
MTASPHNADDQPLAQCTDVGLAPGGHGEGNSLREAWDANAQAVDPLGEVARVRSKLSGISACQPCLRRYHPPAS